MQQQQQTASDGAPTERAGLGSSGLSCASQQQQVFPAVTFPLTAGVRGMLRQLSAGKSRSHAAVQAVTQLPEGVQGSAADSANVYRASLDAGMGQQNCTDMDALQLVKKMLMARNQHGLSTELSNMLQDGDGSD